MAQNKSSDLESSRLHKYFLDYSSNHRTKGNKITHYFGITFIVISLLGLLAHFTFSGDLQIGAVLLRFDAAILILVLGILWYLYLDWKIGAPFALVLFGFYFLGRALTTQVNWTLFIIGWILQFIGHYVFEKKSPSFFKSLVHLLTGPLWIFAHVIGYQSRPNRGDELKESKQ